MYLPSPSATEPPKTTVESLLSWDGSLGHDTRLIMGSRYESLLFKVLDLGYVEYKVAIGVLLFDHIGEVVNLPVISPAHCAHKGLLMPKSYNFRT